MIRAKADGECTNIKIEGKAVDLLTELNLLNLRIFEEISKKIDVSLHEIFEMSFRVLGEVIEEEGGENNGQPNS